MEPVKFSDWKRGMFAEDVKERSYYGEIAERRIEVVYGWECYKMRYLVTGYCATFQQYADIWCEEHGDTLICCGFGTDHEFLAVLKECYSVYCEAKKSNVILETGKNGVIVTPYSPDTWGENKKVIERRSKVYFDLFKFHKIPCYAKCEKFMMPFLVRGYCGNFDVYWSAWMEQIGPNFDLKANRVTDRKLLEELLEQCYKEWKDTMKDGTLVDMM